MHLPEESGEQLHSETQFCGLFPEYPINRVASWVLPPLASLALLPATIRCSPEPKRIVK